MATTSTNTHDKDGAESLASQLGLNRIGEQLQGLVSAMADRGHGGDRPTRWPHQQDVRRHR
jgi:hypothetical protein